MLPASAESSSDRPVPSHQTGQSGSKLKLIANYFELCGVPQCSVLKAQFTPETQNYSRRNAMLHGVRDLGLFLYDGSMLLCEKPFSSPLTFTVTEDGCDSQVAIVLTPVDMPEEQRTKMLIQNLLNRVFHYMKLTRAGTSLFEPRRSSVISRQNLVMWSGFTVIPLSTVLGSVVSIDLCHKLLQTPSALEVIQSFVGQNITELTLAQRTSARMRLTGTTVVATYSNVVYRVDGLEWTTTPTSTFFFRGCKRKSIAPGVITYAEYYQQIHGIRIRNLEQPMIVHVRHASSPERSLNIYLVPELCRITGVSEERTRRDSSVMKDISQLSRANPSRRVQEVEDFASDVARAGTALLSPWGIRLQPTMVEVAARVLPAERVLFGDDEVGSAVDGRSCEWTYAAKNGKVRSPRALIDWVVVSPDMYERAVTEFVRALMVVSEPLGIKFESPRFILLRTDSIEEYEGAIESFVYSLPNRRPDMVFCVLNSGRHDRYEAIKRACLVRHSVPSQCMRVISLQRREVLYSVCTKILSQMVCKMGGELWHVRFPRTDAIVIGVSSQHVLPHMPNDIMFGFCATLNASFTEYFSDVVIVPRNSGRERGEAIARMTGLAVQEYVRRNGAAPGRVIVFREELSMERTKKCLEHDVEPMLGHLKEVYDGAMPRVAYVLLRRFASTRFYQVGRDLLNPPPGAVIDNDVVHPHQYSFFLLSQSVRLGTVSPTHYLVVHDDTLLSADQLQLLVFKLSHLYFNWSGTIRMPAPVQYAAKLAGLVGTVLRARPSEALRTCAYYL